MNGTCLTPTNNTIDDFDEDTEIQPTTTYYDDVIKVILLL